MKRITMTKSGLLSEVQFGVRLLLILVLCCSSVTVIAQSSDDDGDGVSNALDLDDDNDGILDTAEGCYDTGSPTDGLSPGAAGGIPLAVRIAYAFTGATSFRNATNTNMSGIIALSPMLFQQMSFGAGIPTTSYNASDSLNVRNLDQSNLSGAIADADYLQFQFETLPANFSAYLDWFGFRNGLTTNPTFDVTFQISSDGVTFSTLGTKASGPGQLADAGRRYFDNVDYALAQNTTYTVRIYIYNLSSGTSVNFDDAVVAFDYCRRDTDGDGILDFLDLDSDNDGCLDAIEGGAAFVEADLSPASGSVVGIGSGSSAPAALNLGNSVDGQGIPLVASGGQSIGDSINPTAVVITADPQSQSAESGDSLTFSVAAQAVTATAYDAGNAPDYSSGTVLGSPDAYQWQVSMDNGATWGDISGETSDSITVSGISETMDGYQYRVVMTCVDNACPVMSGAGILSFIAAVPAALQAIPTLGLAQLILLGLLVVLGAGVHSRLR